jgi:hypothetical protein
MSGQDLGIRNPSRDLTQVLRRPVEPAAKSGHANYAISTIGGSFNNAAPLAARSDERAVHISARGDKPGAARSGPPSRPLYRLA